MISTASVIRILAFCFAFFVGVAVHSQLQSNMELTRIEPTKSVDRNDFGFGSSGPNDGVVNTDRIPGPLRPGTDDLRIISKPRPGYTNEAREANVQGTVVVRVTFLASGNIGDVSVTKELSDGLTEQAISAAKRIRFQPAMRDGVPITVTKQVEYTFTIY